MANIDTYMEQILTARYGKEVRQAIYNAIDELNTLIESGTDSSDNVNNAVNQVVSTIADQTPVREGRELLGTIEDDLVAIMQARYGRDVRQAIHDAIYDINEVAQGARNSAVTAANEASQSASVAAGSATSAGTNATLSRSYAVGGTGTRTSEDTDNAKYYANSIHPGVANGVATLDSNGRVPYSQLPESAMEFKGTWNASTNTPTLVAGQGDNGDFYVVSVGGTWHSMTFEPNDRIIFDGVIAHDWIKLVAGEVNSVNGQSGAVQLDADDIPFDNTGTDLQSTNVEGAIKEAYSHGGVNPAPEFDETVAYGVSDYVTYDGTTYRFTAIKTAGAWDSTKVQQLYAMGAYVTAGKKSGTTLGSYATAEGGTTTASGYMSHAEGYNTTASSSYSHAEGHSSTASGNHSHAEGIRTTASGAASHAEGNDTAASGNYAHAEGWNTTAQRRSQHVFGEYNVLDTTGTTSSRGDYVEIVGNGTSTSARLNARTLDWSGNEVLAGGLTAGGEIIDGNSNKLSDKVNASSLGTASTKDVPTSGNASTTQVVMGNDTRLTDSRNAADVYSWAKASTKPSYTASEVGAIATTLKGANNGVAELDSNGKVPSSQLPSYVDDVLSYASLSQFPVTGETGKIYIAEDTNKQYRWSGSAYVEISESLALGETSSTAYAGNKGKANADNIATIQGVIPSSASTSNKLATASDLSDKVDKVAGKGLSTNDYDATAKTKLDGLADIQSIGNGLSLDSSTGELTAVGGGGGDGVLPAPLFSTSTNYGVGDYVTYNGATYRFKNAHSAGAWNSSDVKDVYVAGQYVTAGQKSGTTLGLNSTAEGIYTEASGNYAHAEGQSTQALHNNAHVEGYYTKSGRNNQHVEGKYNVGRNNTIFELGNGTADDARSNAFEVYDNGNVVASGTITDGQGHVLGDSGHVIKTQAGTSLTQRANMQFLDASLTDDSTNNTTKVELFKEVTKSQLDNLGSNTDGFYSTTDEGEEEITATNLIYTGSKTVKTALDERALQSDLTNINATGSTNTTGSTITRSTYFYLDGVLVVAKANIASGAAFTLNTNYEVVTAGALNALVTSLNSPSTMSTDTTPFLKGSSAGEVEAYSFTASYAGELMAEVYFASITAYTSMSITVNGYHMDMYGIGAIASNPITYLTNSVKATFNRGDVVKVLTRCDMTGTMPTMDLHFRKAY